MYGRGRRNCTLTVTLEESCAICYTIPPYIMIDQTCINCNQKTNNPKFCSRSCSASWNNSQQPKRKMKVHYCNDCSGKIDRRTWTESTRLCKSCINSRDIKNKTLGEYRGKLSVKGKHPSWIHSHVRQFCRSWNKELLAKPCANCGYDKHVELCHIKAVSSFPDSALLEEVNHPDNVIQLCRNCHWEFDSGILTLSN